MPLPFERSICWLRRDLRLSDHAALCAATGSSESVAVAFIFDTCILGDLANRRDRRVNFILQSLEELDLKLAELGSQLIVRHGDPTTEIPRLAAELGAQAVFAGRDYEPYARERDERVRTALSAMQREFILCKDSVLLEPGEVLTRAGGPFSVFTPYRRAWRAALKPERDCGEMRLDPSRLWPMALLPTSARLPLPTLKHIGFESADLWLPPGEEAGRQKLAEFLARLDNYESNRNFPARRGTSELSAHLRFGTVSVRELARTALSRGGAGAETWLSELTWRDFFQDILYHSPDVVKSPYRPAYANLEYPGLDEHFEAWKAGQTGFPIVDAAMRCFNQTGWMHNRLRMVVASFLTKDLLIDYRRGEAYFAAGLLDFELASNNGGWQWCASVGADAQPYFRVFNPVLQSRKFDPEGSFIREWCPELDGVADVHEPSGSIAQYPRPIVDHAAQARRAIALLSAAKGR